jgi:hypothetical protein
MFIGQIEANWNHQEDEPTSHHNDTSIANDLPEVVLLHGIWISNSALISAQ